VGHRPFDSGLTVTRESGPGVRKFTTEFTLILTVHIDVVGRQQDLARVGLPEGERPSHLYLVTRRPVISIDPNSVVISDDEVRGKVRLQRGNSWDEFDFDSAHAWGTGCSWQSQWPHDEFQIIAPDGTTRASGVVAHLVSQCSGAWPREAQHHSVVYIGQAFGSAGECTAWDRLQRHETVQRIMSETPRDQQVWLSLASITDVNVLSEIDPRPPTSMTSDVDDEHIARVMRAVADGDFRERDAVALAEAGVIRFFQPPYNDRLKYNFPARKQVHLDAARALDLHGLVVELQGEDAFAYYESAAQPVRFMHFAGYAIHLDPDRADTVALDATDRLPGIPPGAWES
jgi:hypothetical protein